MMMMMKNPMILITCSLLFSSIAVQANQGAFAPDECCFGFISTRLPKSKVVSLKLTDERCSKKAVLFTMKKGARICADLSAPWVQAIIKAKERLQTD